MRQFKLDSKKKVWHIEQGKYIETWWAKECYTKEKGYEVETPDELFYSYCGVENWEKEFDDHDIHDSERITTIIKRKKLLEREFTTNDICPSCIREAYAEGKLLITPIEEAEDE